MKKAERNAQIVARIQAGEKRYMLAVEFGLARNAISAIGQKAGLGKWQRFKRQAKN